MRWKSIWFRGENVVFTFDINEVAVTASRENLSYGRNEPTAAAIKKKVDAYTDEIKDKVRSEVLAGKNSWEQRIISDRISKVMGQRSLGMSALFEINTELFGLKHANITLDDVTVAEEITTEMEVTKGVKKAVKTTTYHDVVMVRTVVSSRSGGASITYPNQPAYSVQATENTVVVIQDMENKEQRRTGYRINLLPHGTPVVWLRYYPKHDDKGVLLAAKLKKLEGATVYTGSDLPEIPSNARGVSQYTYTPTLATVVTVTDGKIVENTKRNVTEEEAKVGGFIVPTYRGCLGENGDGETVHPRFLVGSSLEFGYIPKNCKVIVVPATLKHRFKGTQWKNLIDKLEATQIDDKLIGEVTTAASLANDSQMLYALKRDVPKMKDNATLMGILSPMFPSDDAKDMLNRARMLKSTIGRYFNTGGVGYSECSKISAEMSTKIAETYPMLSVVYGNKKPIDIINSYVYTQDTLINADASTPNCKGTLT